MLSEYDTQPFNNSAQSLKGKILPDFASQFPRKGLPQLLTDPLITPPVTQNPNLVLQCGDKNQNTGLLLGTIQFLLVKGTNRPLPNRLRNPIFPCQHKFEMRETAHEKKSRNPEQDNSRNI